MKRMLRLRALLLLCLTLGLLTVLPAFPAFSARAQAQELGAQNVTLAGRTVVVWQPALDDGAKHPLILFSHGFLGCATQSDFLMRALAADGYWVLAPNHADARCGGGAARVSVRIEENFLRPDMWDETSYADRREDMVAVLDALRRDPVFAARIDFDRLGLAGHSLGGYTVLGLSGAWPDWRLGGVKAVLALSPYSAPFNVRRTMGGLDAPVMFQGGTRDYVITPYVSRPGGSYDTAPMPKYFVEFSGASHMAWTQRQTGFHDDIARYAVAFFDHYLKGAPATADLITPDATVAVLRYASDLGSR